MSSPPVQVPVLYSLDEKIIPPSFPLDSGLCMLGRDATCHIIFTQNSRVSRLHATIERRQMRYILSDALSTNGTFVNETRIHEPHLLSDEDVIGLGAPEPILRFSDPDPTDVVNGRILFDARGMQFYVAKQKLELTPNEFRLMHHLYRRAGRVCSRESCTRAIWQRPYEPGPDDENLDRTMSNLRRKLRQLDPGLDPARLLKTHRGLGYELVR